MNGAATVVFDLDGTLTDSGLGIIRSAKFAIARLNETTGARFSIPDENALRAFVGPPLHVSFASVVGAENAESTLRFYRDRYATIGLFENEVYPGIIDALRILRDRGTRLYVATSKPEPYARKIIEHFDLSQYFLGVYGAEFSGAREQKPELLAYLKREVEADDPWRAVMIGDRKFDVIGAKAVGIPAIGALWGYGGAEELRAAGADFLIESPSDIPQAARVALDAL